MNSYGVMGRVQRSPSLSPPATGTGSPGVVVIANLVSFERTLRTVARVGREADDAH